MDKIRRQSRLAGAIVAALITFQGILLAWAAFRDSPTWDEVGHMAAGLSHWKFKRFDLYKVNPHLVRLVATLPVHVAGAEPDWTRYDPRLRGRQEFSLGTAFLEDKRDDGFFLFTVARWMCIPFILLGGYAVYRWSRSLYGRASGLMAMALWVACPNIIGYGHLITPDGAAAALGVWSMWLVWRWLCDPTLLRCLVAGAAVGLAMCTKSTWLLLLVIVPLMWLIWLPTWASHRRRALTGQLVLWAVVSLYTVDALYLFDDTFRPLGEFQFVSRSLAGAAPHADYQPFWSGNRFATRIIGELPVPLPGNYVLGIDSQRLDFERQMASYLRGQWRSRGWWDYYLYAFTIKVPLGTLFLGFIAGCIALQDIVRHCWRLSLHRRPGETPVSEGPVEKAIQLSWRDELMLLLPFAAVFALVSSQTGFNHHIRYVLPAFPFFFVWISKSARSWSIGPSWLKWTTCVALVWSLSSSLSVYPHSLSSFNEFVGGSEQGHWHLGSSNVDWGEDLFFVKEWYDAHPEARPFAFAHDNIVNPKWVGIHFFPVPPGPVMNRSGAPTTRNWLWRDTSVVEPSPGREYLQVEELQGPVPGWFAMSVNQIHRWEGDYEYFLEFEPVTMIGYSVYIYHITHDEANRVRRKLGLPELRP